MKTFTAPGNTVVVYVAGCPVATRLAVKEYVTEFPACVFVTEGCYVYPNGQEFGVAVSLTTYPRPTPDGCVPFPRLPHELMEYARRLVTHLMKRLHESSALVVPSFGGELTWDDKGQQVKWMSEWITTKERP